MSDSYLLIEGVNGEATCQLGRGCIAIETCVLFHANASGNFTAASFDALLERSFSTLVLGCATGRHFKHATLIGVRQLKQGMVALRAEYEDVVVTQTAVLRNFDGWFYLPPRMTFCISAGATSGPKYAPVSAPVPAPRYSPQSAISR